MNLKLIRQIAQFPTHLNRIIIRWCISDNVTIGTAELPALWWCWQDDSDRNFYETLTKSVREKPLAKGIAWEMLYINIPFNCCFFSSTWTIDLCYLLRRFDIRHKYATMTVGVNPTFRNHKYYGEILWRDHVRVSTKFDLATSAGLLIQRKTVGNRVLLDHISRHGPIIVLTNGYLLHCDLCHASNSKFVNEFR